MTGRDMRLLYMRRRRKAERLKGWKAGGLEGWRAGGLEGWRV